MRCYFVENGHITAVENLSEEDELGSIAQARELFELKARPRGAEGFEIWDRARFVYRYLCAGEASL